MIRSGWRDPGIAPLLLLLAVILGSCLILAAAPIGGGDYGQWLMASRQWSGQPVPDYRDLTSVPPVVPVFIAMVRGVVPDPVAAVRVAAILLLGALGMAAYLAATSLYLSRLAGLFAAAVALLVTDRFLELFAFGGLLQAAAIVFVWLAVAAFARAGRALPDEWTWWTLAGVCVALGSLAHVGTAAIAVPVGLTAGLLCAVNATSSWRERLRRLAPTGVALAVAGLYWLAFLLPGGTELATNPASLGFRGVNRLVENLAAWWPTIAVMVIGAGWLAVGAVSEARHRFVGPQILIAAWAALTMGLLLASVLSGAGTDYPRFATPLLAPLVIAAAGALLVAARVAGSMLAAATRLGTSAEWSVGAAVLLIAAAVPFAADAYHREARGYQLTSMPSLVGVAGWLERNVPADATVLAPVREGKWIEGLTGREALFSNAVRYSFRPSEWERSLAADTMLQSNGAIINEFFFAKLLDEAGSRDASRGIVLGVNHSGEYLDLLRILPSQTRITSSILPDETLATLSNLTVAESGAALTADQASVRAVWDGERQGSRVALAQRLQLRRSSSTLEVVAAMSTALSIGEIQLELWPGQLPVTGMRVDGRHAELTFGKAGAHEPRLRISIAAGGVLEPLEEGRLRIRSGGNRVRLLVTALTGSDRPSSGLDLLRPDDLVEAYRVGAVLLVHDPSFEARRSRMEALGFRLAYEDGPYAVMVRDPDGQRAGR